MIKPILIKPIIYVLLLEEDKYYIGITLNLNQRIAQHFSSEGSIWTKKYKPIKIIEVIYNNIDELTENQITIKYMLNYGWANVRGGSYCKEKLTKPKCICIN